jgi:hypothetical protein
VILETNNHNWGTILGRRREKAVITHKIVLASKNASGDFQPVDFEQALSQVFGRATKKPQRESRLVLYLSEKARSIFKNVSILVCYLIQAILIRE